MNKLIIFPFNGNGLEAVDACKSGFELIGFIDDTIEKQGMGPMQIPVHGRNFLQTSQEDTKILAVPGSPTSYLNRKQILNDLNIPSNQFATVIHSSASVSPLAKIGHNVLIMAGVVITSNAIIGNHVIVLPGTIIHHDVVIGDYSILGSQVICAGHVNIAENCYIGSGSKIKNNVTIGAQALVGMGSNVISSVAAKTTVVGNPAKKHTT